MRLGGWVGVNQKKKIVKGIPGRRLLLTKMRPTPSLHHAPGLLRVASTTHRHTRTHTRTHTHTHIHTVCRSHYGCIFLPGTGLSPCWGS